MTKLLRIFALGSIIILGAACSRSSSGEPSGDNQGPEIYVDISANCREFIEPVSYFAINMRATDWDNAYKSFINCSRSEWISFANTNKSLFKDWKTYLEDFYANDSPLGYGIILANQKASEVLDKACLEIERFKGEFVFEVDMSLLKNSSACTK